MPTKKGLLSGSKVTASHTTVIPEATVVIQTAKKTDGVRRIIPSRIAGGSGRKTRGLKIKGVLAGLEITVRGSDATQTVWVYTNADANHGAVQRAIEDAWQRKWR